MVLPTRTKNSSGIVSFSMKKSLCFLLLLAAALKAWSLSSRTNTSALTTHSLDLGKVCPNSLKLNQINDHLPPSELLEFDQISSLLKYWHEFNCPQRKSCTFVSIGQHLLHHAIHKKKTLLTLQVGAMDGKSNDPMHKMLYSPNQGNPTSVGGRDSFTDLLNWLPIMIEPMPTNYQNLLTTYDDIAKTKNLGCAVPINAVASYNTSKTICPFCRINTSEDAPKRCKNFPAWKRLQLGSLECDHLKEFLKDDFDLCIIQDPLPCSSISKLLSDKSVPSDSIAMLQVDVEGYEYALLQGFLKEIVDRNLPLIIHFEHKILLSMSQLDSLKELLESKGYVLYNENNEDTLALRLHSRVVDDDGTLSATKQFY